MNYLAVDVDLLHSCMYRFCNLYLQFWDVKFFNLGNAEFCIVARATLPITAIVCCSTIYWGPAQVNSRGSIFITTRDALV